MTQAQKIFVSIIALLFFFTGLSAQAIVKSGGVFYTNGAPTHSTNFNTDAELAIDTTTGYWYEKSRDGLGWLLAGFRIQETGTSGAPTLAPADKQSYMVINAGDSLYHYRAAAWRHINQGTAYTGGTGISVTGTVITNTGDLSTSNEGVLGVGAGSSTTSTIISNTTGATGVTVTAGTGLSIAESTSSNGGTITLTNSSPDQTVSLTNGGGVAVSGSYPNFTLTATDQSTTNEVLTISDGTNSEALGGQTLTVTGGGINVAAYNTGTNTLTITGTEIDGTVSNEGSLTVGAGSGTTSLIQSNTSGSTAVTLSASTGISISESGNTITLTNSSPDQTVSITNGGGIAVSGTYPAFTLTATDQSITNENLTITDGTNTESLAGQTLTVTGAGINTAVYNTGTNTLTITGTEVDGSVTNEIQTYGHSGTSTYTNTLSGGGGSWSITGGGIAVISQTGGAVTVTATEVDGSTTNEVLTISDGTNSEALGGQTLTVAGAGINVATYTPGTNTLTITGTEVDGLVTNEGSLTVAAGGGNDSQIHSNTSGSTDVVIAGGTNVTVTESGSTIIISATPGAGVTDLTFSGTSSPVTLNSSTGTDVTFTAGGINTFSATGTNITITGTEVDGVTTNEGSLTVGAGSGTTSLISSNTSGSTDVTLTASTGLSISESGNVITLTNSAPDQTISITNGGGVAVSGTYPSFTLTATDQSITNEVLTITDGTNTEALGGQTLTVTGAGINTAAYNTTTNTLTITGTEVDGSTSNELQTLANTSNSTTHTVTLSNSGGSFQLAEGSNITLTTTGTGTDGIITIAATGAGNTDLAFTGTSSPITLTSSTGTDVTFTAAGINSMSASGSNITITATEVDGSISNELQTYSHGGTTTYTNTLSNSGGSWSLTGAGIAVISQTAGAVTVTATEVDGSISNEGSLTVGAGSGTTSIINSNTSGSTGVTVTASTGLSISESGNVITLTNSAPDQTVSLTNGGGVAVSGTYPSFTLTATDQSTTNEVLTISDGTNTEALGGQTLVVAGAGINVATYNTGTNTLTVTGTEVDGSISNEGSLTVGAGTGTTSIINSNTSGSTGVTLTASTGLSISESGNVVTLTNSSPDQTVSITNGGGVAISGTYPSFTITATDQSITNELQTITNTSNSTTHTATLSSSGGSIQLVEGANITLTTSGTGLDGIVTIAATSGSGTDLSVTGTSSPVTLVSSTGTDVTFTAGGINAISASSGNITITATEVDGSVTNELQTIANTSDATSHTVTLSNSGGSVQLVEGSGITMATTGTGGAGILTITAVDASATNEIQTYGHAGTTTYTNTLSGSGGSWSITGAGIAAISQTGGAITVTATEVDGSVSNELQTYSHGGTTTYTNTLSNSGGSWSLTGAGIAVVSQTAGAVTVTATEVDGSISNEGSLTVGAGSGTTSIINSNTSGSTGVTLTASTGLGISESGNVITLTNSSPDQTVSLTNGGGIAVSGTYPSFTLTATDQSITNEGILGVSAGSSTTSVITSNTSAAVGVTITAGTSMAISETTASDGGTITLGVATDGITTTQILDVTIVNNDISNSAAIANSKLANSGVTAGTYPNTGGVMAQVVVNSKGIITGVNQIPVDDLPSNDLTVNDTVRTVNGSSTHFKYPTALAVQNAITSAISGSPTDLAFAGTSSPVTLTSSTGTDVTFTAGGINAFSASGTNITITGTEVDGSVSNEGLLTVGAGTGATSLIQSNTSGSTNVTLTAGTGLAISESGNTITLSAVGGSSPDSTWAKTSGIYANKRITDNIYRTGAVGIRTPDTLATLNLREKLTPTANLQGALSIQGIPNGDSVNIFVRLKSSDRDSTEDFVIGAINSGVISAAGKNTSWYMGQNIYPGGSRIDTTRSAMVMFFEDNFTNPLPIVGSVPSSEMHWGFVPKNRSDNAQARVISTALDHLGRTSDFGIQTDKFYIGRFGNSFGYRTDKPALWASADFYAKTYDYYDTLNFRFAKNNHYLLQQRDPTNSFFVGAIKVDASNRVYLGGQNEANVAAYNSFQITNSGNLWNEGGYISIGKSGLENNLLIDGFIRSGQSGEAGKIITYNHNTSTSYASSGGEDNYHVINSSATTNNWSGLSSYSSTGDIDAAIGFRHLNHASAYGQVSLFARNAANGFAQIVDFSPTLSSFYFPVSLRNTTLESAYTATFNGAAIFNGGMTVNTVPPTFNTPITLGGSVGSKMTIYNDYSPTYPASTADYEAIALYNRNTTTNNWTAISFNAGGVGGAIAADVAAQYTSHGSLYADLAFHTRSTGGYDEVMRVTGGTNGRKVGILTASPAETLHVTGNIRADGTITTRGTGTSAVVKMINTTPSTGRQWDMVSDDDGDWFLTNSSLGVSLSVSGTTGDVNIPDKLILSSLASTPTSILGINASNEVSGITVGSGLTLSAGVLSASGGGGATNLTFSGASSPVTLASSTGTDVTFVAGTGITLSQSSNALTINATNSGAILNGGNITGATLVIGTNDANALQFETNNVPRVAITGGASTGGAMTLTDVTANTSTIENALVVQAQSSGTAATGFGTGIVLRGESSTTNDRDMFSIGASWTTATDASRVAKAVFSVANNTALSESFAAVAGGITIGASAQPTLTNASFTTAGAYTFGNSANNTTLGGSTGLVTISSSATSGNPILLSASGNSSSVSGIIGNTTYSYGSGTKYEWRMNSGYTPSSGTGAFYNLGIFATISHSGASGDCGAINIEPTQTVGYKYRAIRIAGTNSSDIYPIHQIGSAPKSIFEGSITIGTTSPQTEKLNVWGNIQLNTGQIYCTTNVLTDGATIAINWNNSNSQRVVLGGNRTITFSNPKEGAIYVLKIAQDATGSRTLTWPTVKWKGGAAPILSTAANAVDVITLMYIGAEYLGEADLGFQ